MKRFSRNLCHHHGRSFLALALVLCVAPLHAREARIHFAGSDSVVSIEARSQRGTMFFDLTELGEKLKLQVERDLEAGLLVVCGPRDCVPLFLAAEEDVQMDGERIFVNAERALSAACANTKVERDDIALSCRIETLAHVGADEGNLAPGFALKVIGDSVVTLDDLLAQGALLLGFVRSGEWDPTSRLLLRELQARSDTLRKLRINVAVIHGYDAKTALKWAKDLWISYPLLTDGVAAVMRGYHVFDQGHLPHCALFAITSDRKIAWKKVFAENEVLNVEDAVKAVRQK